MQEAKSIRVSLVSRAYELKTRPLAAAGRSGSASKALRKQTWFERVLREVSRFWYALRVQFKEGATRRLQGSPSGEDRARSPRTMRLWLSMFAERAALAAEREAERAERQRQEAERRRRRIVELSDAQVAEEYRRLSR